VGTSSEIQIVPIQNYLPPEYLHNILGFQIADDIIETEADFLASIQRVNSRNRKKLIILGESNVAPEIGKENQDVRLQEELITVEPNFEDVWVSERPKSGELKKRPTIYFPETQVRTTEEISSKKTRIYDELEKDPITVYNLPELDLEKLLGVDQTMSSRKKLVQASANYIIDNRLKPVDILPPIKAQKPSAMSNAKQVQSRILESASEDENALRIPESSAKGINLVRRIKSRKGRRAAKFEEEEKRLKAKKEALEGIVRPNAMGQQTEIEEANELIWKLTPPQPPEILEHQHSEHSHFSDPDEKELNIILETQQTAYSEVSVDKAEDLVLEELNENESKAQKRMKTGVAEAKKKKSRRAKISVQSKSKKSPKSVTGIAVEYYFGKPDTQVLKFSLPVEFDPPVGISFADIVFDRKNGFYKKRTIPEYKNALELGLLLEYNSRGEPGMVDSGEFGDDTSGIEFEANSNSDKVAQAKYGTNVEIKQRLVTLDVAESDKVAWGLFKAAMQPSRVAAQLKKAKDTMKDREEDNQANVKGGKFASKKKHLAISGLGFTGNQSDGSDTAPMSSDDRIDADFERNAEAGNLQSSDRHQAGITSIETKLSKEMKATETRTKSNIEQNYDEKTKNISGDMNKDSSSQAVRKQTDTTFTDAERVKINKLDIVFQSRDELEIGEKRVWNDSEANNLEHNRSIPALGGPGEIADAKVVADKHVQSGGNFPSESSKKEPPVGERENYVRAGRSSIVVLGSNGQKDEHKLQLAVKGAKQPKNDPVNLATAKFKLMLSSQKRIKPVLISDTMQSENSINAKSSLLSSKSNANAGIVSESSLADNSFLSLNSNSAKNSNISVKIEKNENEQGVDSQRQNIDAFKQIKGNFASLDPVLEESLELSDRALEVILSSSWMESLKV
jgi:hypothetical protein